MKDSYARDSLNSPRRVSRYRLLVLDAPCTERYARCGERTGVNHPLLLDSGNISMLCKYISHMFIILF